ncbi:ABC transporter ATP-binding protein [Ruminococcus sp.]|uniref:ABC transporter ATP-binding protein n=1 Tax=Ruminococcus sp. TaxID=41978 RepID=UPI0025CCFF5D|nr:ABC transporter ATP-binding protein [Ruminococcus sp.]MBQ8967446.1 ABC transporter ATP-binding protein [Ruminococcus sp.]
MDKRSGLAVWWDTITYGDSKKYGKFIAWLFFDSLVASIPSSIMMIAVYYFLAPVLDKTKAYEQKSFWVLAGILLAQTIAYAIVRRKSYLDICVGHVSAQQEDKLRLGDKLKTLPMGFFADHDAGEISTLMMRNYEEIENLSSSVVGNGTVILIRLLIALVVLSIFNIKMTLAMFVVIPLAIPFAVISYRRVADTSSELLAIQQQTADNVIEYAGGITTLQAYDRTGSAFEGLKNSFARLRDDSKKQEKAGGAVSMYGRAILFLGISIVMGVGAYLLSAGEITPFFYIMCLLAALQVYEPIMQLFVFVISLARINQCIEKLSALKAEKELAVTQPPVFTEKSDISFRDVHFAYDGKDEVIRGISFDIPERKFVALVGSSGSGKTTIARLLARFWDIQKGEIRIGGAVITSMTQEHLLSKISMVFQDVYLFRDTIEENIRIGRPDATHEEIVAAARAAACHDLITSLPEGYETMVGEGGSTLSGGEKQRISIARAILSDAPIVFLDEATASLDPENEVLIQRAIDELVKNKTVLVIAHRLRSVMNADDIIVLDNGRITEEGSHDELLTKGGRYAVLWKEQATADSWKLT